MNSRRKISTRFRELLKQELQIWQSDGIVSAEQSAKLSQKYNLDQIQKESTNLLLLAIYIIGTVLIGGGVISFVAAHWESIPPGAKVAMIIACMLASHIAGYYLWKISGKNPRLGHALVVLGTLIFGANIGLMAQIFHIRSHFYNGFFAWAAGAILMAYALQSVPNAVIAILVWFIGFCGAYSDFSGRQEYLLAVYPFIAAAVFLPFAFFNRSAFVFSLSLLAVGIALVIHTFNDNWTHLISFGLVAPGIALLFLGSGLSLRRTANFSAFGSCAMEIAAIFAALGAYLSSFHSYGMSFPDLLKERAWLASAIPVYVLGAAAGLVGWKAILSDARIRWISAGLLVSCLLIVIPILLTPLMMDSPDSFWCVVLANVGCAVLAGTLIVNAFLLLERRIFWAGILLAALVIASRFLEYETELLIKAVVFITCGIVLILAGVGFENYLKRRRLVNE